MDLKSLNTKDAAEAGSELHFTHPAMGHPMYSGAGADPVTGELVNADKPNERITGIIRGMESKTVRDMLKAAAKAKLTNRNRKSNNPDHIPTEAEVDQEMADAQKSGMDLACVLLADIRGLSLDGKPMESTTENKRMFFDQSDDLVSQVVRFAKDNANFFGKGSKP
jgi:hypothetical protein